MTLQCFSKGKEFVEFYIGFTVKMIEASLNAFF